MATRCPRSKPSVAEEQRSSVSRTSEQRRALRGGTLIFSSGAKCISFPSSLHVPSGGVFRACPGCVFNQLWGDTQTPAGLPAGRSSLPSEALRASGAAPRRGRLPSEQQMRAGACAGLRRGGWGGRAGPGPASYSAGRCPRWSETCLRWCGRGMELLEEMGVRALRWLVCERKA